MTDENGVARIVLDTCRMSVDIPEGQVALNAPSEHALVGECAVCAVILRLIFKEVSRCLIPSWDSDSLEIFLVQVDKVGVIVLFRFQPLQCKKFSTRTQN